MSGGLPPRAEAARKLWRRRNREHVNRPERPEDARDERETTATVTRPLESGEVKR